jgi:long-chain-fatty-acid--[acyl-carrier-protein] ligase
MKFFIGLITRWILSLRYRVEVKGLEKLEGLRGVLFLPNHPAHADPMILFSRLWPKFGMRSVIVEYMHRKPVLRWINRLTRSIAVPNFDVAVNQYKVKRAEETLELVVKGLKRGENFGFYPAGHTKSGKKEMLGGASGCHSILERLPEVNVALVRTTGLWGSCFSRAFTGKSPDLGTSLKKGLMTLLKNGIFFAPRRRVVVEIEVNPVDLPRRGTRLELNRYLENWYNRVPDPLKLVSYSMWREEVPTVFQAKEVKRVNCDVSEKARKAIYGELRHILKDPKLELKPEMNLSTDLGMDSINQADLIAFFARHYGLTEIRREDFETVGDLLALADGAKEAAAKELEKSTYSFPEEVRAPLTFPEGETIPEVFLKKRAGVGCGDDVAGVLTYKRMRLGALALAQRLKKIEGEKVAVMLPASCGAYVVILAIQLSGKVPVMLNWTLGPRYLEEMMKISGAKTILSSWRFLDRLPHVDFGSLTDQILLLEDLREEITLGMKLKALLPPSLDQVKETAVILFTSGTEATPKAVPLTHKNILTNQRDAIQWVELNESDIFYSALPPFHSFGFTVAGLLPILYGVRVAFYPNPSNSIALAEGIARWKATLFSGTPTFLKGVFNVAEPDQLKTVRYFVAGAEKAPPELYSRVTTRLLEGYGSTECSPIISLTPTAVPSTGVGRLSPSLEGCTIHPETHALLPPHATGEICVRGPSVFGGYLAGKSPFIEIDGKTWYRTGDLGHIEKDRTIHLSGRLKRFTKIGGEMISLRALEEVLSEAFIRSGIVSPDVTSLAVSENLTLYSIADIEKELANKILKEAGFSNLIKLSAVKQVREIPHMASGKIDYRRLATL